MSDPICTTCGELKSSHVETHLGPFTHPREASGEGVYRLVRQGYIAGRYSPADDDFYVSPYYKFTAHHDPADAEDSG